MEDLEAALKATPSDIGLRSRGFGSGSCSALIKLLPGYKELYVSHDTWGDYNQMLRIFKRYDLLYDIGGGFREWSSAVTNMYPKKSKSKCVVQVKRPFVGHKRGRGLSILQ